ncbi:MAG: MBL fold metallo-hydrolase [Promethearchaeota archaeon]
MLEYTELGKDCYLVKEVAERVNTLNPILIEDGLSKDAILIDANYPFRFIDELYRRIKSPAKALILSHTHTDHSAHAFYHQEKYHTPIYVPSLEEHRIKDLAVLRKEAGFDDLGLTEVFNMMILEYMKFKECQHVKTYIPGETIFYYELLEIKTIHIPGHAIGHTAFNLTFYNSELNRNILYVSDIGSHPYYGDLDCNLKEYYESIDKLEKIYLSDDYILVPAHGTVYIEKNEGFFQRIRDRIKKNEKKVLEHLSKTHAKSIKELVLEWFMTPIEKRNALIKDMYFRWDGGMIYQHLSEFIKKGIVKKVEVKDFLNDKYILV